MACRGPLFKPVWSFDSSENADIQVVNDLVFVVEG